MSDTPTISDSAEWLADFVYVNGEHLRPNVEAMHEAATERRYGLDTNEGLIHDPHHAALFACCLSGDADLWKPAGAWGVLPVSTLPGLAEHLAEMWGDCATEAEGVLIADHLVSIGALRCTEAGWELLEMDDEDFFAACAMAVR